MKYFICETCGVQYGLSEKAPPECTICNEERQYVNPDGQTWTTLEEMLENGNWINAIHPEEEGLYSIHTTPKFAIGQTAYLAKAEGFNLLWDCVTYLDPATIEEIKAMGGVDAIALSHPHYYSTQVEWAEAFDAKIYIHEDDRRWVVRMSERIVFWSGDRLELHEGVTLHRIGGHFKGAAIAHLAERGQRKRRGVCRRHHPCRGRSKMGNIHVQLPQFHSAPVPNGPSDRCLHERGAVQPDV